VTSPSPPTTVPSPGATAPSCPECGGEVAPTLLACPGCHRLVHAATLSALAGEAEAASAAGDDPRALAAWRRALELLPPSSAQSRQVGERIVALSRTVSEAPATPASSRSPLAKAGSGLGVLGLLAWKFKFALVFVLTKLKFLLLGLSKVGTLLTMLLSFGVYWTIWGWRFALGVVLAMYVHEMGHVAALRRFGIAATAPMFVPGLGAFVRLRQSVQTVGEDARVGLAGPIWGLGASLAAYAIHLATGSPVVAAVAKFSAWLNLFNLLPLWQLDGGRGLRALSRPQRWILVAVIGLGWWISAERLLPLLLIVAVFQAWSGHAPEQPDAPVLVQYAALVLCLALLATVAVPGVSSAAAGAG
jgi:Zn-dependent protease